MASLVDAHEAEVARLAHLAADVGCVGLYWLVACRGKLLGSGVVDGETRHFAAEPVTCKVSVAVQDGDVHALVEQVGQIVPVSGREAVLRAAEGGRDGLGGCGEVHWHANCSLYGGIHEIALPEAGGERVSVLVRKVTRPRMSVRQISEEGDDYLLAVKAKLEDEFKLRARVLIAVTLVSLLSLVHTSYSLDNVADPVIRGGDALVHQTLVPERILFEKLYRQSAKQF